MRIWDIDPKKLCRQHLLGEHRELHAIWNVITKKKKGYSQHPETKRWVGRLKALYNRHEREVTELHRRGWRHLSPLDKRKAVGAAVQSVFVDTPRAQRQILARKKCNCLVRNR